MSTIKSYKGFDADFKCRGFQFEVGKTYQHKGSVEACKSGFHACEYPLDVLKYYAPAISRFAVVTQTGELSRHAEDSKVSSSGISIDDEIGLSGLIQAAVTYVIDRAECNGAGLATGEQGASLATGLHGASSATGEQGASLATGLHGASSATGRRGASSATGRRGAASATGAHGAASATGAHGAALATGEHGAALAGGEQSVASSVGIGGRAKAAITGAIVLCHRSDDGTIKHIRASKVGENGIKPDAWYTLDSNGDFIELAE